VSKSHIYLEKGGDEHGRQKGRLRLRMCWAKAGRQGSHKEEKQAQKVQITHGCLAAPMGGKRGSLNG